MIFLCDFKRLPMEFQRDSCGIWKDFHWIPMGFLWEPFGISMIFLLDFYDMSQRLPLGFRRISMGMKQTSMICSWYFRGIPVAFLLDFHEVSMEYLWHFYFIPVGCLCVPHMVFMISPLDFYGMSIAFL